MAAPDRVITQTGPGPGVSSSIQDELTGLWNMADIRLTSVGGTANAITATLAPALTGGLTAGMKFSFIPVANNTGAATIAINGGAPIAIKDDDGNALGPGLIVAGRLHRLESDGTALRLIGAADIQKVNDYQLFTASGTWTKPPGTPDDAIVWVYAIGGGAGGGNGNNEGGGGGGAGTGWVPFRAGNLASTVAVTVGAGGAMQVAGGNTSFGSHLVAYGGGYAGARGGGAGGGPYGAGGNGGSGNVAGTVVGDGGNGGDGTASGNGTYGQNAIYGGGGGGGGSDSGTGGNGGHSIWGGGGGGADGSTNIDGLGGQSKFAGNGGNRLIAGTIPGGGGGSQAAGARGQLIVHTIG